METSGKKKDGQSRDQYLQQPSLISPSGAKIPSSKGSQAADANMFASPKMVQPGGQGQALMVNIAKKQTSKHHHKAPNVHMAYLL